MNNGSGPFTSSPRKAKVPGIQGVLDETLFATDFDFGF